MLGNQEVFDRVVKHLLTQMKHSTSESNQICMYRGDRGLRCAIGCLIPDELYRPWMELTQIDQILEEVPALSQHIGEDLHLLYSLQSIHDCFKPQYWREKLVSLARNRGLVCSFT